MKLLTKDMDILTNKQLVSLFYKKAKEIKPDIFCEIGAYEASASKELSDIENISIFAYEANKYIYEMYRNDKGLKNVNYKNLAISNTIGKVNFYIMKDYVKSGANSLLKRNTETYSNLEYELTEVDSFTLDSLHSKDKEKSYVLWIDVEGCGLQVLEGSKEILKNTKLILIEVENIQHWEDQKMDKEIISFLESYGFKIVARDQEYPNQYNIMFEK
jgi:FkbM family methyltransferase